MADQSSDSATASLRLATKTIIEEFCASPSPTATLVLRLKKGTFDVSSLDPISRLALTVLRQLFDELEKAVRNCAQQSESNTTDIGGRVLNCLRHDEDANQKETLDRLARQFLNRKNVGADKIRGLQSNDSEEKNIKFLRTASKSPAEILNFMSENDSSIEYATPKLPGQLPTLPLEQLSDSEQSSTASGSSKGTKSRRSDKSVASSRRSGQRSPSGSNSSRRSTGRESFASTTSTHTSYNSGDIRLVDDSTVHLDMVARQVTAHLLQNEQFVEQLKVLQAAGLPLTSPDVLMLGQTPLIQQIQAIALVGASSPLLPSEPIIPSQPWNSLDETPQKDASLKFVSAAARKSGEVLSLEQANSPLREQNSVSPATHAVERDGITEIDARLAHLPARKLAIPVETQTDLENQGNKEATEEVTQDASSVSQDLSSSTTSQSLSFGQIPMKKLVQLAQLAPSLNVITVRPDGSIMNKQPSNFDASQPVRSAQTRKPKVSEWLQGQKERFTVPVLDLTSDSSTTAPHTNRDRAPLEVVSALGKKYSADDEDASTTLDEVTEMSA